MSTMTVPPGVSGLRRYDVASFMCSMRKGPRPTVKEPGKGAIANWFESYPVRLYISVLFPLGVEFARQEKWSLKSWEK
jgi:hypothetical protein